MCILTLRYVKRRAFDAAMKNQRAILAGTAVLLALVCAASALHAQRNVPRAALQRAPSDAVTSKFNPEFILGFELGVYQPSAPESAALRTAPGFALSLGVRPDVHYLFEGVLSTAVGAARIGRTISTTIGSRGTSDFEAMLLLGSRLLAPSADGSFILSAGGGWALASYEEIAGDPSRETIYCTSCLSPTGGTGGYGVVEIEGRGDSFGLALVLRAVQLDMKDYFARSTQSSSRQPRDSWVTVSLKLSAF